MCNYVSYKKTMLPINHMVEMAFASSGKENSTNGKLKCRSRWSKNNGDEKKIPLHLLRKIRMNLNTLHI